MGGGSSILPGSAQGGGAVLAGWRLNLSPILTAGKHTPLAGLGHPTSCFLRSKTAAPGVFHLPPGPRAEGRGGRAASAAPGEVVVGGSPGSRPSPGASPHTRQGGELPLWSGFSQPQGTGARDTELPPSPSPLAGGPRAPSRQDGPGRPRRCPPQRLGGTAGPAPERTPPPPPANTRAAGPGRGERFQRGEALEEERRQGSRLWRKRPQDTGL